MSVFTEQPGETFLSCSWRRNPRVGLAEPFLGQLVLGTAKWGRMGRKMSAKERS